MDESALQQLAEWLKHVGGAGIAILPLVFLVGIIQIKNQIGTGISKLVGGASKGASGFGEKIGGNINNRRDINAAEGRGVWGGFLGSNRRRRFRSDEKAARLAGRAKHAQEHYVDKYTQENERYQKQLAGGLPVLEQLTGGRYGVASAAAMENVFAGAKFRIEKAELEEVKAAHATIDLKNEADLRGIIHDKDSTGNYTASAANRAAALERLVQIGGMSSIADAVDEIGNSGKSDIVSKSLANALRSDGPGWLKAADIDSIGLGKLGQDMIDAKGDVMKDAAGNVMKIPSNLADMTKANLAEGTFAAEKMATASKQELAYASDRVKEMQTQADPRAATAIDKLKNAAKKATDNPTLSGKLKHNEANIQAIKVNGYIP